MNRNEQEIRRRDRKIAHNEGERQVWGDIRVSSWAILTMVILIFVGWLWMRH